MNRSAPHRFLTTRRMACLAMMIALQIILSRFLGIQINEGLRISFESVPVILTSLWFGPLSGALVGLLSDFLGTLLSGYGAYFLPLAITPLLEGILPGVLFRALWKGRLDLPRAVITVCITMAAASLLCGTYALTWYYTLIVGRDMPFLALLALRAPAKVLTMAADSVLVFLLHRAVYAPLTHSLAGERI